MLFVWSCDLLKLWEMSYDRLIYIVHQTNIHYKEEEKDQVAHSSGGHHCQTCGQGWGAASVTQQMYGWGGMYLVGTPLYGPTFPLVSVSVLVVLALTCWH
jgi:hypothetical protein